MKKLSKNKCALRVNISDDASRNIDVVKATLMLSGTKMTKEEVVNLMLTNYKSK